MKYLKLFEELKSAGQYHNFYPDSEKYEGKFFIAPVFMSEQKWKKELNYIVYCTEVLVPKDPSGTGKDKKGVHKSIYPHGECFTLFKNGEIKLTGGYGISYSPEEFSEIHFMTAQEFYDENEGLCTDLFKSL